jgi:hypothetical protein
MKRNVYKDTMHELVKPILTDTPTDKVLRRKKATQLKKSARQERAWAETAFTEERAERARALKLPRGDPLRTELLSDSRIAKGFGKIRLMRADKLEELANNLLRSLSKPKIKTRSK